MELTQEQELEQIPDRPSEFPAILFLLITMMMMMVIMLIMMVVIMLMKMTTVSVTNCAYLMSEKYF